MILNRSYYFRRKLLTSILNLFVTVWDFFALLKKKPRVKTDQSLNDHIIPSLIIKDNKILCRSCGVCSNLCPTQSIALETKGVGSAPSVYNLNLLTCMSCFLCVEKCPEKAIGHLNKNIEDFDQEKMIHGLNDLFTKS